MMKLVKVEVIDLTADSDDDTPSVDNPSPRVAPSKKRARDNEPVAAQAPAKRQRVAAAKKPAPRIRARKAKGPSEEQRAEYRRQANEDALEKDRLYRQNKYAGLTNTPYHRGDLPQGPSPRSSTPPSDQDREEENLKKVHAMGRAAIDVMIRHDISKFR